MWRLLTAGIKVIIAVAALTTAANWVALRAKDRRAPGPALAATLDPPTTGALPGRRSEARPEPAPGAKLDQRALMRLVSEAGDPAPRKR
ncbi:hypothetical protein OPKNFCMD_3415 [Methylobacterium crusticola]|uniref:Uncharacterized protein n=1 Tax=Methylobacterium crusticola TaxID=1697972 RepID=A0ABQ4QZR9_9HYPH|nr:hypothetical protein [Methylobacterium crusticola]GJD50672.1 hypothetical protein OPKNFCMD_3415 [Methylobacterium crusticola]